MVEYRLLIMLLLYGIFKIRLNYVIVISHILTLFVALKDIRQPLDPAKYALWIAKILKTISTNLLVACYRSAIGVA